LASLLLFQHRYDLFVCESFLHLSVLFVGRTLQHFGGVLGAQVSNNKRKEGMALSKLSEFDAGLNQRKTSSALLKRMELLSAKATKGRETCHLSDKELVQLFRSIEAISRFSAHLDIGLRKALTWLRKAGVDVIEEVAKEWEDGSSIRKLSQIHGPMPQTISNWIKSTGRQVKSRNSNKKYDEERIKELCTEPWPTNKIAKNMGLS
ncbi:MAG: hypothetical protein GQ535_03730, partial [Rhodobacteraceae bacterium]|nr:hypothetical protein [Paracoccaceae bacterium]